MTAAQAVVALKSIVFILALCGFVFRLWRDYCVDAYRESIFTLRGELFLAAARGDIRFEEAAYRTLRERLNVSLRYAHEFTLSRFFVASAIPNFATHEALEWADKTKDLPQATQAMLNRYRTMFVTNVLRYMILRSYVLAILVVVFKLVGGLKARIVSKATPGVERLESEALEEDCRRQRHSVVAA